jgi:hypothetical protein
MWERRGIGKVNGRRAHLGRGGGSSTLGNGRDPCRSDWPSIAQNESDRSASCLGSEDH